MKAIDVIPKLKQAWGEIEARVTYNLELEKSPENLKKNRKLSNSCINVMP
jgi:hypothetical protein